MQKISVVGVVSAHDKNNLQQTAGGGRFDPLLRHRRVNAPIRCGMRVPRKKACLRFRPTSRLKLVAMATSLDQSGKPIPD